MLSLVSRRKSHLRWRFRRFIILSDFYIVRQTDNIYYSYYLFTTMTNLFYNIESYIICKTFVISENHLGSYCQGNFTLQNNLKIQNFILLEI